MKRTKLISILLVSALGLAVVFGGMAFYAAKAAAPVTTTLPHGGRGPGGGYTVEDLANVLGITVDEVNAAYEQANNAALEQAVEKDLITQAQADDLKDKGVTFPFGNRWAGWLSQNGIDYEALLADALGITVDKLQAAYQQAFYARIDQAVADGKLSEEQADLMKGQYALHASSDFQTAMQTAFETAIKQAVTNGVITQAQADKILAQNQSKSFFGVRGFERFGEREFGGMRGPHSRGGWGGQPSSDAPPPLMTP